MIGLVTDSNSQLPPELADRYGVEIVPLSVIIDGTPYDEGTELTADDFYARFADGTPDVATSQPSPGAFAEAYGRLVARGATEILSIHIGAAVSGTLNSARLVAPDAGVPVRLVDTGTASFGVACCVWEAAEALAAGASLEEAATLAEELAPTIGNVFVVGALELALAGGRMREDAAATEPGVAVLSLVDGEIKVVAMAADLDVAAGAMAEYAQTWGTGMRAAVGTADEGARPLSDALAARLAAAPEVDEVVHYRIGPSVGVHTGPGTSGAFYYPALRR